MRATVPLLIGAALLLASCTPTVKLDLSTQKPIQITMDENIRIDKELDDFFSFEDTAGEPAGEPEGEKNKKPSADSAGKE